MIWAGLSGDGVIWLLADKIMSVPESKARSAGVSAFAESTYLTAQIASPRGRVYMHTLANDDAHAFTNVIEKCVSISKMDVGGMSVFNYMHRREAIPNFYIMPADFIRRYVGQASAARYSSYIFSGASNPSICMQSVSTRLVSCRTHIYPAFLSSSSSVSILTS